MKMLVILLIALQVMPFIITQIIVCDHISEYESDWEKRVIFLGGVVNIGLNLVMLLMVDLFVFNIRNPFSKIRDILKLVCSYQDIQKLSVVVVVSIIMSIIIGVGIYYFFYRELPEFSVRRKCMFLLVCLFVLVPVLFSMKISWEGLSKLQISEICRKTTLVNVTPWGESDTDEDASYIVISNTGDLSYQVDKIYVSDNEDGEDWLLINNVNIGPGESYKYDIAGDDSLNIKKKGGSIVYLMDVSGNVIDEVTVPALSKDSSYKLENNSWSVYTWKEENDEDQNMIYVAPPAFSRAGGFYDGDFELILSADPKTTIYYTVDCSIPTTTASKYTGPITIYDRTSEPNQVRSIKNVTLRYLEEWEEPNNVDKAMVVRAIAVDTNGNASDIATETYFVNKVKYNKQKVISLVADPEDLFGDNGIYVTGPQYDSWYQQQMESWSEGDKIDRTNAPIANFNQRSDDWERSANLELFSAGVCDSNQPIGIKIQGNTTRGSVRKRFSLYSRKEYSGSRYFDTPLLSNYDTHSLVLRQGNMNALSMLLVADRDVVVADVLPVVVFLNGEYLYHTYLLDKYTDTFFATHFGVSENNVILAKAGNESDGIEIQPIIAEIYDYIDNHNLSDAEAYDGFNDIVDIQSYIDYSCTNLYLGNMDDSETTNFVLWKTAIPENNLQGDGRWRFVIYDMDLNIEAVREKYGYQTTAEVNSFEDWYYESKIFTKRKIFSALRSNPEFCKQFVLTFLDMANYNFSNEHVSEMFTQLGRQDIESYDEGFFLNRADFIIPYMAEEFNLSGTLENVDLMTNRSGTPIKINTIMPELSSENVWTGKYYTDYPVTVTAIAPGFDHWEVVVNGESSLYTEESIEVPISNGGVKISAIFK